MMEDLIKRVNEWIRESNLEDYFIQVALEEELDSYNLDFE